MSLITDPARLRAVERSRLLDSPREMVFDELTAVAAKMLDAPFAFMTVVDNERSYWKSTHGIHDGTRHNAVEDSFCQYVVESGGAPLLVDDARAHDLTRNNPSIESMGVRAWAGCAVELDGETLGTFCVVDQRPRTWSDADRDVLERLASVASREIGMRVALARAKEEQQSAADEVDQLAAVLDTLRMSLLPPALPDVPGVDLAAWFSPASDGHLLLGDFYDVFELGGGRWGLVVGDVCGHGPEAARLTSLVRFTLRAAAMHHRDPIGALTEVHEALDRDPTSGNHFATLCYVTFSTGAAPVHVTLARAGHPYPLVRRGDGTVERRIDASGPPVGVGGIEPSFVTETFELAGGESLVLYTDGCIEGRDGNDDVFGMAGLEGAVADAPGDSADALVQSARAAVDAHVHDRSDDMILLALTATG